MAVIVVDNDPKASAREIVEEVSQKYRWPLVYAVESRTGIPQARNRCLNLVHERTDYVCFIDDDEWVEPAWLEQLLITRQQYEADVVAGPVVPVFPPQTPDWVLRGRLLMRARHATGTLISEAATNNVLFRLDLARRHGIRFFEAMALTGGEDKLFFEQLRARGAKLTWSDEAIVHEAVPADRIRPFWFIQRGFRIGTTDARTNRLTKGLWLGSALSMWRSASRGAWALSFAPVYVCLGKGPFVYNLSRLAFSVGSFLGSLGMSYNEYAAPRRKPATFR